MRVPQTTIQYIIEFLVGKELAPFVVYGAVKPQSHLSKPPTFQASNHPDLQPSKLLTLQSSNWFENPRMPDFPVREFEGMPVLFWAGDKPDFVASAYFLLSRYEELLNPERDEHGRFPGKASVPFKAGFLDRPIVDEYGRYLRKQIEVWNARSLEVLKSRGLDSNPPNLQSSKPPTLQPSNPPTLQPSKPHISKLYLTHDVDHPFETRGLKGRIQDVVSNLIRRHKFSLKPIIDYLLGRSNPDCFDWILDFDQSILGWKSGSLDVLKFEKEGAINLPILQSSNPPTLQPSNPPTLQPSNPPTLQPSKHPNIQIIYFLLARKNGDVRDNWYLEDRRWPDLLSRFRKYGVTLGLHTSYAAGGNMSTVKEDVACLANHLNIQPSNPPTLQPSKHPNLQTSKPPNIQPSRHHFLRMTDPSDFRHLESAGITDDFSVGYADVAGFRVGTCRPYRWIDPRTGTVGKLVIHPMTIMECTLDGANYMGLTEPEAREYSYKLIDRVAEFGGECVLLWHNTSLVLGASNWQRDLYRECSRHASNLV